MLIEMDWPNKNWWKEKCLEREYFHDRIANEEFFRKAQRAAELTRKDALEVFYIAVVLGFRGFYSDRNNRPQVAIELDLPADVAAWLSITSRSLQLGQGRSKIVDQMQSPGSARPLTGKSSLIRYSMISVVLVAIAIAFGIALFGKNLFG
jgi:type VI secretion system protein ImpK